VGENRQILLQHIRQPDQHTIAGYESRGGYQAIRKAMSMEPTAVIEDVVVRAFQPGKSGLLFRATPVSQRTLSATLTRASQEHLRTGYFWNATHMQ
jgi:hypothetical protein